MFAASFLNSSCTCGSTCAHMAPSLAAWLLPYLLRQFLDERVAVIGFAEAVTAHGSFSVNQRRTGMCRPPRRVQAPDRFRRALRRGKSRRASRPSRRKLKTERAADIRTQALNGRKWVIGRATSSLRPDDDLAESSTWEPWGRDRYRDQTACSHPECSSRSDRPFQNLGRPDRTQGRSDRFARRRSHGDWLLGCSCSSLRFELDVLNARVDRGLIAVPKQLLRSRSSARRLRRGR